MIGPFTVSLTVTAIPFLNSHIYLGRGTRTDAHATTLWRPITLIWAMLFFQAFGVMGSIASQTQLFEDIACRRHFGRGDPLSGPDEESCKDPAVQDMVNELFGWQLFFDGIPGLVMAMYYGAMADEKGRKPVLMLSLVGQALGAAWILLICWMQIDPRWTWLSSTFYLIGGGGTVFNAAAMMILTDASLESFRSKAFFYAQGVTIVGEMLAPPLGAYLMRSEEIPASQGSKFELGVKSRLDAAASYLFSFQAFGQMLAYGIFLPVLDTTLVSRFGLLPRIKDLYLSRLSVIILAISFALLAFAPSFDFVFIGIVVFTLGTGFQSFARSLVSSLVDSDMIGTVFTALAIMDTMAILLAGPVNAAILKWTSAFYGMSQDRLLTIV
ncbi:putative mfs multidrug [Diaporthe ampelina]|uniref:Putative mfs multidrug n=1 Tax=Diaporthe ampelina TaxID=1214573 RepID=A0A0G2HZ49_9PEZI|nr:putative mfs multidrug [Diaporthe ampelina]